MVRALKLREGVKIMRALGHDVRKKAKDTAK